MAANEPMTDIEYYQLSVLFEQRELTEAHVRAFTTWLDHYTEAGGGWASAKELIDYISNNIPMHPEHIHRLLG